MVASNSIKVSQVNPSTDRLEVLSVMIDALWLYMRSINTDETKDRQLNQKLEQANESLYEIMSYLEETK